MPTYTADSRHHRLVLVLPSLLARSCPPHGGGYGGSWEIRLTAEETENLGGLDLLRSAVRAAARSLGWAPVQTYGMTTSDGWLVGVADRRTVPEEYADAVERFRMACMRAAVVTVHGNRAGGGHRAVPGSGTVTTHEFRAAFAEQSE